jgi:hypothetical protein
MVAVTVFIASCEECRSSTTISAGTSFSTSASIATSIVAPYLCVEGKKNEGEGGLLVRRDHFSFAT